MQRLRIQDWSLGRIARAVDGRLINAPMQSEPPRAVCTDTRSIAEGDLFFALRGERFDGHEFVELAVEKGACALVVDDKSAIPDEKSPAILVDDSIKALGRLGHALWREARQQGLHAVAVTGSNGKTTTKEFLHLLWGLSGKVWATPGNLNNHIGVPLTLCALPADCDHLIVEMGANHVGEICDLIRLAPADERIITSIGRAHLEGFGSISGVRRGKSEIFEHGSRATVAIVPHDERAGVIPAEFAGNVLTFGTDSTADMRVVDTGQIEVDGRPGTEVHLAMEGREWKLNLPLLGEHNALNLAAAMSTLVSRDLLLDEGRINEALSGIKLPAGRFRTVKIGDLHILDDAYNANPTSMRASFEAFEDWCAGENSSVAKIAVFGDMLEMGDVAEAEHRRFARWLSERHTVDAVAFTGVYGSLMANAAKRRGGPTLETHAFAELDDIADWLGEAGPARVFLKGSRGNRLERVVDLLRQRHGQ